MSDLQAERIHYLENGFDPIPLRPHSKAPQVRGWQTKPTLTQWRHAQEDANIGLRAGAGKAFIDCDDKNHEGTTETITRWLGTLGYMPGQYPVVQTPNHGTHIYVNFAGTLLGSSRNLNADIGAGEFRYGPGAQVAAYPSVIPAGEYRLTGDIARLPSLDLNDVRKLINLNEPAPQKTTRKIPRLAAAIMAGTIPDRYKSASDAEAGMVLSLINAGYALEDIRQIFENYPCAGHYRNKYSTPKERSAYLYRTYQKMLAYSQHDSPTKRKIGELLELVTSAPWKSANRRSVLIAHLEIANRAGRLDYAAAVRDIALRAGVSTGTAYYQTQKILDDKLLTAKEPGTIVSAAVYSLKLDNVEHSLSTSPVRKCSTLSTPDSFKDAFRNGGGRYAKGRLGKRAGEIYNLLTAEALTVREIVQRTGACEKTVRRALAKMHKMIDPRTGEVIEMVSQDGKAWYANLVDLDYIAAITRTFGAIGRQRMEYEKERRSHARGLELAELTRGK